MRTQANKNSISSLLSILTPADLAKLALDKKRELARWAARQASRQTEISPGASLIDWCHQARWLKADAGLRPFSFIGHEYLRQIYADTHPYIVIEKAAQMGATEYALSIPIYCCDIFSGFRSIYFFPTDTEVEDFSRDRVEAALQDSPYLLARCGELLNVHVKPYWARGLILQGDGKQTKDQVGSG